MNKKEFHKEIKQAQQDIDELYMEMSRLELTQDAAEVYRLAIIWCNKCRYHDALVVALRVAAKEGKPSV